MNINEIEDIKLHLKSNYIQCFKYNYALDSIVQNYSCYPAIIEISKKSTYIKIINRKPVETIKRDIFSEPIDVKSIYDDPEYELHTSSASCYVKDI